MKHSKAFQTVNNDPNNNTKKKQNEDTVNSLEQPVRLCEHHGKVVLRHLLCHCNKGPEDEKSAFEKHGAQKRLWRGRRDLHKGK